LSSVIQTNKSRNAMLNELFDEWEDAVSDYKGKFVRDGIIDEELYNSASPKILFVEKEPNDPTQESGDFRIWWKQDPDYPFLYRIAEWSYGLLNDFPQYDEIRRKNDLLKQAIQQVAFMNIKKSGGGGRSDYDQMIDNLRNNVEFLHREIEIISPEIIILGVTWPELRDLLLPDVEWIGSGYDVVIGRHKNSKVIDFYHPSSRTAPAASYSLLQNVVNANQFKKLIT